MVFETKVQAWLVGEEEKVVVVVTNVAVFEETLSTVQKPPETRLLIYFLAETYGSFSILDFLNFFLQKR